MITFAIEGYACKHEMTYLLHNAKYFTITNHKTQ